MLMHSFFVSAEGVDMGAMPGPAVVEGGAWWMSCMGCGELVGWLHKLGSSSTSIRSCVGSPEGG
jgi:hypothetical protein